MRIIVSKGELVLKSQVLMNAQAKLFNVFPNSLKHISDIRFLLPYLSWRIHPVGFEHASSVLSHLQNRYNDCRCVILGNGPSLRKMDLSLLKDEFTFGLNRIYLMFNELGFETTYLIAVNRTVLDQFSNEILNTDALKLLSWLYKGSNIPDIKTAFISVKPWKGIDGDILNGYSSNSGTVTTVAIETAFFMGFSEIILIGVDHSYVEKGTPGLTVISKDSDPNHFDPNYFGKGIIWQLPDLIASENAYRKAKDLFENQDRSIIDATREGKLQVFVKDDFEGALINSIFMNKVEYERMQK